LAGEKLQRRTDAKPNTGRVTALRDCISDQLLLRRANTNEGETRRLGSGERCRFDDRFRLLFQAHRRAMPTDVGQRIAMLQRVDHSLVAADNADRLTAIDHIIEEALSQICASRDRQS